MGDLISIITLIEEKNLMAI